MTEDLDQRTDDDKKRAQGIMDATNGPPEGLAQLVYEYYRDRADRTPRSTMYLHMGMLAGAVMRAIERR